ncbi:hypothetical protein, partial [Anaerosporobacter sp.]|uniref:hypothetical protein n=1 Tax=Anaerosporobacter sp. TaxID=1872529 RepID=UPI00286F7349
MRKIKLNKCNIRKMITMTVLIMMIVLCLTSCSKPKQANLINQVQSINSTNQINQGDQESQTPEIEEKSVTTVYEDKSQKEIVYGELRFEISPYHIASKEEWESYVEFYCELDSGEDSTETSKVFRIEKCTDNGVVTFEDAKNYFAKISEFKIRESFQNIHDESGIIKMYTATAEEGLSYYMCYFQKEVYLITTENPYLAWNLIEGDIWDWKQEVQYIYNIETKNQFTIKVIENRICQEDSSSYEIYSKDGNLEYKAELTIEPRKTEEYGFCYSYRIYDATDKEVQCLEWESTVIEYPKFVDLNQDGSVDMQVVIDQAPSYDVNELYIWNEAEQHYEKVLYDGTLADISVEDGYLLNWVRAGVEGYVIEKLIFEGTRLIKVSEEVVMPEGEDTSTIVLEKIRALDVTIKESPLDISPEVDALYKEAYLKMLKSEMPIVYGNGEKEYFRDLYKAGSEFE